MNPSRHLIPRGEGRGLLQRLGIVVAVALAIAGIQFAFTPRASSALPKMASSTKANVVPATPGYPPFAEIDSALSKLS